MTNTNRPNPAPPVRLLAVLIAGASLMAVTVIDGRLEAAPDPQLKKPQIKLPEPGRMLDALAKDHPRIMARPDDFQRVRRLVEIDDIARRWFAGLKKRGEAQLKERATIHHLRDGVRLLSESRETLDRVRTLGMLYRLTGDKRYHDRIWRDMQAVAQFPDWNPGHFLDTAEMTAACAIAYDWLYHDWTDAQRATIRQAILKHGLEPGLRCYEGKERHGWWTRAHHNWNQVCNGGLGLGALAIGDEEPEIAGRILHEALKRLPDAMALYAPDGGYHEGAGYWAYGTRYNVYILAALDTALGTDFGLSDYPAFDKAGDFPVHMCGPIGKVFNFADGGDGMVREPALLWLARRFEYPMHAKYQVAVGRDRALNLLWYDPTLLRGQVKPPPRDTVFRRIGVMAMRSRWDDRDALFVGFKAGDNRFNHGNLDQGSFVLDALGERWAIDLGKDNYNMPGYFAGGRDGRRWTYYRMRAEGHNTLVINPGNEADQDPLAEGRIEKFESNDERAFGIVDITPAYAAHAKRVRRGVWFDRRAMVVRDEMKCKAPSEVWWFMHTQAQVRFSRDRREAILSQDGKQLRVRLITPDAALQVLDARPLPAAPDPKQQHRNEGIRKLAIKLEDVREATIVVHLQPVTPNAPADPPTAAVKPLDEWE